ncbi:uncharacterized protein LOC101858493 [Aplysia californica]|uniref:Uncharacterized protein LOC101858493 n=1 Tax=Aplysia californica TaxID=6500 RepID=A0ABM0JQ49_APLCA|nr:uncharacterized protein LOC101858493 [Aplysia californica]XP_005098928.1 uncharacterized protein LOC101858493 [Aplysia californica]XP_005098929.1 uncharacterized protein LOC101858493 [Aplysia californica]
MEKESQENSLNFSAGKAQNVGPVGPGSERHYISTLGNQIKLVSQVDHGPGSFSGTVQKADGQQSRNFLDLDAGQGETVISRSSAAGSFSATESVAQFSVVNAGRNRKEQNDKEVVGPQVSVSTVASLPFSLVETVGKKTESNNNNFISSGKGSLREYGKGKQRSEQAELHSPATGRGAKSPSVNRESPQSTSTLIRVASNVIHGVESDLRKSPSILGRQLMDTKVTDECNTGISVHMFSSNTQPSSQFKCQEETSHQLKNFLLGSSEKSSAVTSVRSSAVRTPVKDQSPNQLGVFLGSGSQGRNVNLGESATPLLGQNPIQPQRTPPGELSAMQDDDDDDEEAFIPVGVVQLASLKRLEVSVDDMNTVDDQMQSFSKSPVSNEGGYYAGNTFSGKVGKFQGVSQMATAKSSQEKSRPQQQKQFSATELQAVQLQQLAKSIEAHQNLQQPPQDPKQQKHQLLLQLVHHAQQQQQQILDKQQQGSHQQLPRHQQADEPMQEQQLHKILTDTGSHGVSREQRGVVVSRVEMNVPKHLEVQTQAMDVRQQFTAGPQTKHHVGSTGFTSSNASNLYTAAQKSPQVGVYQQTFSNVSPAMTPSFAASTPKITEQLLQQPKDTDPDQTSASWGGRAQFSPMPSPASEQLVLPQSGSVTTVSTTPAGRLSQSPLHQQHPEISRRLNSPASPRQGGGSPRQPASPRQSASPRCAVSPQLVPMTPPHFASPSTQTFVGSRSTASSTRQLVTPLPRPASTPQLSVSSTSPLMRPPSASRYAANSSQSASSFQHVLPPKVTSESPSPSAPVTSPFTTGFSSARDSRQDRLAGVGQSQVQNFEPHRSLSGASLPTQDLVGKRSSSYGQLFGSPEYKSQQQQQSATQQYTGGPVCRLPSSERQYEMKMTSRAEATAQQFRDPVQHSRPDSLSSDGAGFTLSFPSQFGSPSSSASYDPVKYLQSPSSPPPEYTQLSSISSSPAMHSQQFSAKQVIHHRPPEQPQRNPSPHVRSLSNPVTPLSEDFRPKPSVSVPSIQTANSVWQVRETRQELPSQREKPQRTFSSFSTKSAGGSTHPSQVKQLQALGTESSGVQSQNYNTPSDKQFVNSVAQSAPLRGERHSTSIHSETVSQTVPKNVHVGQLHSQPTLMEKENSLIQSLFESCSGGERQHSTVLQQGQHGAQAQQRSHNEPIAPSAQSHIPIIQDKQGDFSPARLEAGRTFSTSSSVPTQEMRKNEGGLKVLSEIASEILAVSGQGESTTLRQENVDSELSREGSKLDSLRAEDGPAGDAVSREKEEPATVITKKTSSLSSDADPPKVGKSNIHPVRQEETPRREIRKRKPKKPFEQEDTPYRKNQKPFKSNLKGGKLSKPGGVENKQGHAPRNKPGGNKKLGKPDKNRKLFNKTGLKNAKKSTKEEDEDYEMGDDSKSDSESESSSRRISQRLVRKEQREKDDNRRSSSRPQRQSRRVDYKEEGGVEMEAPGRSMRSKRRSSVSQSSNDAQPLGNQEKIITRHSKQNEKTDQDSNSKLSTRSNNKKDEMRTEASGKKNTTATTAEKDKLTGGKEGSERKDSKHVEKKVANPASSTRFKSKVSSRHRRRIGAARRLVSRSSITTRRSERDHPQKSAKSSPVSSGKRQLPAPFVDELPRARKVLKRSNSPEKGQKGNKADWSTDVPDLEADGSATVPERSLRHSLRTKDKSISDRESSNASVSDPSPSIKNKNSDSVPSTRSKRNTKKKANHNDDGTSRSSRENGSESLSTGDQMSLVKAGLTPSNSEIDSMSGISESHSEKHLKQDEATEERTQIDVSRDSNGLSNSKDELETTSMLDPETGLFSGQLDGGKQGDDHMIWTAEHSELSDENAKAKPDTAARSVDGLDGGTTRHGSKMILYKLVPLLDEEVPDITDSMVPINGLFVPGGNGNRILLPRDFILGPTVGKLSMPQQSGAAAVVSSCTSTSVDVSFAELPQSKRWGSQTSTHLSTKREEVQTTSNIRNDSSVHPTSSWSQRGRHSQLTPPSSTWIPQPPAPISATTVAPRVGTSSFPHEPAAAALLSSSEAGFYSSNTRQQGPPSTMSTNQSSTGLPTSSSSLHEQSPSPLSRGQMHKVPPGTSSQPQQWTSSHTQPRPTSEHQHDSSAWNGASLPSSVASITVESWSKEFFSDPTYNRQLGLNQRVEPVAPMENSAISYNPPVNQMGFSGAPSGFNSTRDTPKLADQSSSSLPATPMYPASQRDPEINNNGLFSSTVQNELDFPDSLRQDNFIQGFLRQISANPGSFSQELAGFNLAQQDFAYLESRLRQTLSPNTLLSAVTAYEENASPSNLTSHENSLQDSINLVHTVNLDAGDEALADMDENLGLPILGQSTALDLPRLSAGAATSVVPPASITEDMTSVTPVQEGDATPAKADSAVKKNKIVPKERKHLYKMFTDEEQKKRCECLVCGKVYGIASIYRHLRVHDKDSKHPCQDCDRVFSQASSLNAHRRTNHGLSEPGKRSKQTPESAGSTPRSTAMSTTPSKVSPREQRRSQLKSPDSKRGRKSSGSESVGAPIHLDSSEILKQQETQRQIEELRRQKAEKKRAAQKKRSEEFGEPQLPPETPGDGTSGGQKGGEESGEQQGEGQGVQEVGSGVVTESGHLMSSSDSAVVTDSGQGVSSDSATASSEREEPPVQSKEDVSGSSEPQGGGALYTQANTEPVDSKDTKTHTTPLSLDEGPEGDDKVEPSDKVKIPPFVKNGMHACPKCNTILKSRSTLVLHIRRHNKEKTKFCSYCSKGFYTSQELKSHVRTHTGEKPYQCSICLQSFGHHGSLLTHRRIHDRNGEVQPFPVIDGVVQMPRKVHARPGTKNKSGESSGRGSKKTKKPAGGLTSPIGESLQTDSDKRNEDIAEAVAGASGHPGEGQISNFSPPRSAAHQGSGEFPFEGQGRTRVSDVAFGSSVPNRDVRSLGMSESVGSVRAQEDMTSAFPQQMSPLVSPGTPVSANRGYFTDPVGYSGGGQKELMSPPQASTSSLHASSQMVSGQNAHQSHELHQYGSGPPTEKVVDYQRVATGMSASLNNFYPQQQQQQQYQHYQLPHMAADQSQYQRMPENAVPLDKADPSSGEIVKKLLQHFNVPSANYPEAAAVDYSQEMSTPGPPESSSRITTVAPPPPPPPQPVMYTDKVVNPPPSYMASTHHRQQQQQQHHQYSSSSQRSDVPPPQHPMSPGSSSSWAPMAMPSPHHQVHQAMPSPHHQVHQAMPSPHHQVHQEMSSPHHQVQQEISSPHHQVHQGLSSPQVHQEMSSPHHQVQQGMSSPLQFPQAVPFSTNNAVPPQEEFGYTSGEKAAPMSFTPLPKFESLSQEVNHLPSQKSQK